MLARHRLLALTLIFPAAAYGGCVITSDGPDDPLDPPTTSSTSSGGDGGWGGDDGDGGDGGWGGDDGDGGDGGWGGDDGGDGGGGSDTGACIAAGNSTVDVEACEDLAIAPASGAHAQCGEDRDEEPIGYRLCKRAFTLFAPSHAADLVDCLSDIGVQYECDIEPVQECLTEMYENACPNQALELCNEITEQCIDLEDETFNPGQCAVDLNPFSDAGVTELGDCMNEGFGADENLTCRAAYTDCYQIVMSF
ncbi:hypothetical protein SOCE26_094160 [Sorangium cellulosum]|uniref:Secreted protein n=1 Tax=Sorangium cellulosum TaxID=56 RepID=A0A2L0F8J3_SORCE|nr:hypothetical protein [Sorangium cellulosum]AUX47890.1 hypothetical protein SOCE26_094160 [Sorangium cellulosum]